MACNIVHLLFLSACSLTFWKNTNSLPSKGHLLQFHLTFLLTVTFYECFFLSSAIDWLCKSLNALCCILHKCMRHARSCCICKLSSFTELISRQFHTIARHSRLIKLYFHLYFIWTYTINFHWNILTLIGWTIFSCEASNLYV